MTPQELTRLQSALRYQTKRIAELSEELTRDQEAASNIRKDLIKYHVLELTALGITAQELTELLVQTKLEGKEYGTD